VALTNLKSLRNFVQFRNRSDVRCLCVFDIYSNLKCASTLTLHYARSKENNMLPEELNKSTGRFDRYYDLRVASCWPEVRLLEGSRGRVCVKCKFGGKSLLKSVRVVQSQGQTDRRPSRNLFGDVTG
jgi:hypothetical protein